MIELRGIPVFEGTIKGKLLFLPHEEIIVRKKIVQDPVQELEKYLKAKELAISELQQLYDKALKKMDSDVAEIFLIHQMFILDDDFEDSVRNIILKEHFNSDFAVVRTTRTFAKAFCRVDSEYIKGRSADLKDIAKRLIRHIQDKPGNCAELKEKVIICAEELVPSEIVELDVSKILALCTRKGSALSHSAIITRALNIPAVAGLGKQFADNLNGCCAVVNGSAGTVSIET